MKTLNTIKFTLIISFLALLGATLPTSSVFSKNSVTTISLNTTSTSTPTLITESLRYNGPQLTKIRNRYHNPSEYDNMSASYFWSGLKIFAHSFGRLNSDFFSSEEEHDQWFTPTMPEVSSELPKVTWVGHATFLIQFRGVNILTDPIFGDISKIYYHRMFQPGISFEHLPKIDVVVISHNHRDHLEDATIRQLRDLPNPPLILVPEGLKEWFLKKGYEEDKVMELNWGQEVHGIGDHSQVNITFLPAVHISIRNPFDIRKSAWGSWLIEDNLMNSSKNFKIFFAGDTGYSSHFAEISKAVGKINVAIMPIAPNTPDEVQREGHMSAEESLEAFCTLDADYFVPMHWGTFRLGNDRFIEPINRVRDWWYSHPDRVQGKTLIELKIGGSKLFFR